MREERFPLQRAPVASLLSLTQLSALAARRYVGAGLSSLDLISDAWTIVRYMQTPEQAPYGVSLAVMVGVCVLIQVIVTMAQTAKESRLVMLRELVIVLTGLKPGFDAYVGECEKSEREEAREQRKCCCVCPLLLRTCWTR